MTEFTPTSPPLALGEAGQSQEQLEQAFAVVASLYEIGPEMVAPNDTPEVRKTTTPRDLLLHFQGDVAQALSTLQTYAARMDKSHEWASSIFAKIWSDGIPAQADDPPYRRVDGKLLDRCLITSSLRDKKDKILLSGNDSREVDTFSSEMSYEIILPTLSAVNKFMLGEDEQFSATYSALEPNFYDHEVRPLRQQQSTLSNGGVLVRYIHNSSGKQDSDYMVGPEGNVTYTPFSAATAPGAARYLEIERQLVARFIKGLPEEVRPYMPAAIVAIADLPPAFFAPDQPPVTPLSFSELD